MSKENGGAGGSVINISSYAGIHPLLYVCRAVMLFVDGKVCFLIRSFQCTVQPKQVLWRSLKHYA